MTIQVRSLADAPLAPIAAAASSSSSSSSSTSSLAAQTDVAVAGLQNRAGAYVWLGSKTLFRSKFYCGRSWTAIVGWSAAQGRCGPLGDRQCPDCAILVPRNTIGLRMSAGHAREPGAKAQFKDLLYCERCPDSSAVPCPECRRWFWVLRRTAFHSRVPLPRRSHF